MWGWVIRKYGAPCTRPAESGPRSLRCGSLALGVLHELSAAACTTASEKKNFAKLEERYMEKQFVEKMVESLQKLTKQVEPGAQVVTLKPWSCPNERFTNL